MYIYIYLGYPGGKGGYPDQGLPGQDHGYLPPHQPGYPPQGMEISSFVVVFFEYPKEYTSADFTIFRHFF